MIEEVWEHVGKIAGLLSIGNGLITIRGPVLLAIENNVEQFGIEFIGPCGKSTVSCECIMDADHETLAGMLGAKLWE